MRRITLASRVRRAFTLIEVMLAVVIIGLGVLGLSAIFAGAASQQVASARSTEAAELMRSLELLVRDRAGPPTVGYGVRVPADVGTQVNLNAGPNGQYPLGLRIPMTPTVWFPISSYPEDSLSGYPSYALTLDPSTNPVNQALSVFFLNDAPEIELYHNPLDVTAINPMPVFHRTTPLPTAPQTVRYEFLGTGQNDGPFFDSVGAERIATLGHPRVQPGTFRVRFEIARKDPTLTSAAILGRRVVRFDDGALARDNDLQSWADDPSDGPTISGLTRPQSLVVNPAVDRVLFDRVARPVPAQAAAAAKILEFDIALAPYEWIERIVVEPHQWRSGSLLTLAERVRPSLDGSFVGVTTLAQGGFSGSGRRMAMLAYVAEPVQRGAEWIPPEIGAINERLLRRVDARLAYDETLGLYYIQVDDAEDAWLTEIGQQFLIAGDPAGNPYSAIRDAGADAFSRVTRQDRRSSNDFRGYLEQGPTTSGYPFVEPDSGTDLDVSVWALYPLAESLATNNPAFRITPIDGRVIQTR